MMGDQAYDGLSEAKQPQRAYETDQAQSRLDEEINQLHEAAAELGRRVERVTRNDVPMPGPSNTVAGADSAYTTEMARRTEGSAERVAIVTRQLRSLLDRLEV